MRLEGKVVLVTGGAGGIGQALTAACRAARARPITVDLPGRGADIELDVTTPGALAEVIDGLERLDVVVANAGIGVAGLAQDVGLSLWMRSIDVNIRGVVETVVPAYRRMCEQRSGAVVLMASLAGLAGTPLLTPYAMTKSAVIGLGNSLRPEAARYGVSVIVVSPGPVETPLLDATVETPGINIRRHLAAAAGAPISAARLADQIVKAIRHDRARVIPGRARPLWAASRFAPRVTNLLIARGLEQELRAANRTRST